MKKIFTAILLSVSLGAFSQDILLNQNVRADSIRPTRGPNLKHFTHFYVGLGFPVSTNGIENYTIPGLSTGLDLGFRYKRRINNYLATGLELGINSTSFKLKQKEPKTVPDTILNNKEKLQISCLKSSGYIRINIGRRGNYIGNYLDVGAYGDWNFQKKHKTTNENEDGEKVRVSTTRLKYIENFSWGVLARVSVSRYAFTAHYRLSDIYKSDMAVPELPRLIVGVEVGLFK